MQASAAKTALGCSVFTLGATVKYANSRGIPRNVRPKVDLRISRH
jgi:hypothetical protein